MLCPEDPSKYYIISERRNRGGVYGTVRTKKWSDKDGKYYEEELDWTPECREEILQEEQNRCLEILKNADNSSLNLD